MPRQFSFRGDRLAFSWGIVLLAAIAFGILWAFGGDTHALIPLYSVGVFLCFTLSQLGMVKHWLRVREAGWRWRLGVNATGGLLTAIVLGIVVSEKFIDGAYLVVILVPVLVGMMLFINRQYASSTLELAVKPDLVVGEPHREERVVVPIAGVNRAVVHAINVGRSIDVGRPCRVHLGRSGGGGCGPQAVRAPDPGHPPGRGRVPLPSARSGRSWPTSMSSTQPGRRARTIRSRSS